MQHEDLRRAAALAHGLAAPAAGLVWGFRIFRAIWDIWVARRLGLWFEIFSVRPRSFESAGVP